MCLSPIRGSFGHASGKFLCYQMTRRDIEAKTKQIQPILKMPPPTNKKDPEANRLSRYFQKIHLIGILISANLSSRILDM